MSRSASSRRATLARDVLGKRHMSRERRLLPVTLAALSLAGLAYWQLQRLFTEEPSYEIERRIGPLQIRRYASTIRAETEITSPSSRKALSDGFRRLARYIFGGNQTGEKLPMTSPVNQRPSPIAMTKPVMWTVSLTGPWLVSFTMPKGRTLDTLPTPSDMEVHLSAKPARRVAALRFAGRYTSERVTQKARELREIARGLGLDAEGDVEFAGYDPPWTLPFLRRNEVWLELPCLASISA